MDNNFRQQIDKFRNFKPIIAEAVKTQCQTDGAVYNTKITQNEVKISVKIPFDLDLSETESKLLEDNLHNALELVLKPYFIQE